MKTVVAFISTAALAFASCKPVQPSSAGTKSSRYEDPAVASAGPVTMTLTMNNSTMECRLSNSTRAKVLADLQKNPPMQAINTFNNNTSENPISQAPTATANKELSLCAKEWENWLLQTIGTKTFAPIDGAQVALPIGGMEYVLQLGMAGASACGRVGDAALGAALLATLKYAEKRGWVCQR